MKCPKCQTEVSPDDKFCRECAHNLRKTGDLPLKDYHEPHSDAPKHLTDRSSFVAEIPHLKTFVTVKKRLDPLLYVECSRCGAVKVEGNELVMVLKELDEELWMNIAGLEDRRALAKLYHKMLSSIVKSIPTSEEIAKLEISLYEYTDREMAFYDPNKQFSELYDWNAKYSEVLLINHGECDCFKDTKESSEWESFCIEEYEGEDA